MSHNVLHGEVASTEPCLDGGAPLGTGQHSTYGMGELMDEEEGGVAAGGVLVGESAVEQAGSPVKGTIERARVLWPGNALHDLDQQEKVPLSTQAVQYPVCTLTLCFAFSFASGCYLLHPRSNTQQASPTML